MMFACRRPKPLLPVVVRPAGISQPLGARSSEANWKNSPKSMPLLQLPSFNSVEPRVPICVDHRVARGCSE